VNTEDPGLSSIAAPPEWLSAYRERMIAELGSVRILDMTASIPLEKLYIPVRLSTPSKSGPDQETTRTRFSEIDEQRELDTAWQSQRGRVFNSAEDALSEHLHLAVVGDPGAGKTTMLQHLALRLARGACKNLPAMPLVIDLHSLGHSPLVSELPPEELIFAWIASELSHGLPDFPDLLGWLHRIVECGQAVILLDGLDEVADPAGDGDSAHRKITRAISWMDAQFPQTPMVLTCRRAHLVRYVNLPRHFQLLEAGEFEWEHVSRFITAWFHYTPSTGQVLHSQIERSVRIRGLASNPLLLALICIIFQRRGSLPQRRADVYRRCVDVLLAEWDAARQRDRHPRFTLEHKEDLLRRVAWHFHESGQRYVIRDELLGIIRSFLPMIRLRENEAEAILDEITAHHGLLKDFGEGWLSFHHFTLQEHFAMEHITSPQRLDEAVALRRKGWWREIIRLYAGKGDCTELICRLGREREDLFQSSIFLIAECLTEGSPVAPAVMNHTRDELTRIARGSTRPIQIRARAAGLAVRLLHTDDTESLLRWMSDFRVPVAGRLEIARGLAYETVSPIFNSLADMLTSTALDIAVREALARNLSAVSNDDMLTYCLRRVTAEADTFSRQRLGFALGRGGLNQRDRLIEVICDNDFDPAVREGIATALGHANDRAIEHRILEVLDRIRDADVISAMLVTLSRLSTNDLTEQVLETLGDRTADTWVRTRAADALVARDRDIARTVMLDLLIDSAQNRGVRTYIAHQVGSLVTEEIRDHLVEIAGDETIDRFVRVALLEGLGQSRATFLVEPLGRIVTNPGVREYVKRAAVDALGELDAPEAVDTLVELWRSPTAEAKIREHALVAIGRISNPATCELVLSALDDRGIDRDTRRALAESLRPGDETTDSLFAERTTEMVAQSDMQGTLLSLLVRFTTELGQTVYPEDVGMQPVIYTWSTNPPCNA
jgi:HEAT repeat protein